VTFGLPKIGHVVLPGTEFVGELEVIDIGIPSVVVDEVSPKHHLLTREMTKPWFQSRAAESHKGTTGHLLLIGGSPGKTGAAVMASRAAMRVGAGLVTLGIPKSLNIAMESQLTDQNLGLSAFGRIMSLLEHKDALAIGPGLGTAKPTQNLVRRLIKTSPVPVIVDADGLNALAGQERIRRARSFAETHKVHLVLKGARTIVAHPDGTILINPTGNPGMASGGMGDVLTGMISGLIVQGLAVDEAVSAGVYLHGCTADFLAHCKGPVGYLASDVIDVLPEQIKTLGPPGDDHLPPANPFITGL
jgi:NAD(P)H-hydrate epimerase